MQQPASSLQRELVGAILDVNLGGMDGVSLAQMLRSICPQIPLVMISALNQQDLAQLGPLPVKAVCLKKPFELFAIEDAVSQWQH